MKYGISGKNGIKELIDCVIMDLDSLQLNTLQTIELKFRIHPSYKISNLVNSMDKVHNLVGDRDIEIIFETEEDESIPIDEYYLETKYSKKLP